jgi:predicted nucleotidyltransferase
MPVTQDQIDRAVAVARRYGARRVLLFGSALDDPETAHDLDLAVEGVEGWDFFGMSAEMEEAVRIPLDVIPLESDSPFVRHIRQRASVLYERH